jgi:transcriptional regulator with XRE-family HTH domain
LEVSVMNRPLLHAPLEVKMMQTLNRTNDGHPLVKAREALGLTRTQFAFATGLGYSAVANTEKGQPRRLPQAWRPRLERLGIDFDKIESDYTNWRESQMTAAFDLSDPTRVLA